MILQGGSRQDSARTGVAWHGFARRGTTGLGIARQGSHRSRENRLRWNECGPAWRGSAKQDAARFGNARQGFIRRAKHRGGWIDGAGPGWAGRGAA
jgi:hypothetical protein